MKHQRLPLLLLTLLSPLLLLTIVLAEQTTGRASAQESAPVPLPDGPFVARVFYQDLADIERLSHLDLWEFNNLKEKYLLASMDRTIYRQLASEGWRLEIDQGMSERLNLPAAPNLFYQGYRTVEELHAELAAISQQYPALTELVDYGDSYCKTVGGCYPELSPYTATHQMPPFDLLALRITNESIQGSSSISGTKILSGTKPVFFLLANIHAREISTPELAMRMIDWLLSGYGANADASWLVDWHEIWIVPTANPDGHWMAELGEMPPYSGSPFFQRKNARYDGGCQVWPPTTFSQYGVDLNRNHDLGWGGSGSSEFSCDQTYRGSGPASEPEVSQLQELISALIPDQRGPAASDRAPDDTTGIFITLHSFSEMVLWPWGHAAVPAPNQAGLKALGDKLASYNGYRSCQASLCLYSASGTSDDWAYGELGIPAFTFEVGSYSQGFMPPYHIIDSEQWPLNGPALQYAAKAAGTPYLTVNGPDSADVSAAVGLTGLAALSADADDRQNGGQTISQTVYAIDLPFWAEPVLTGVFSADDGSFDSPHEPVSALVDVSELPYGRHILFVRSQDTDGFWGPTSAVFLDYFPSMKQYLPITFSQ